MAGGGLRHDNTAIYSHAINYIIIELIVIILTRTPRCRVMSEMPAKAGVVKDGSLIAEAGRQLHF